MAIDCPFPREIKTLTSVICSIVFQTTYYIIALKRDRYPDNFQEGSTNSAKSPIASSSLSSTWIHKSAYLVVPKFSFQLQISRYPTSSSFISDILVSSSVSSILRSALYSSFYVNKHTYNPSLQIFPHDMIEAS